MTSNDGDSNCHFSCMFQNSFYNSVQAKTVFLNGKLFRINSGPVLPKGSVKGERLGLVLYLLKGLNLLSMFLCTNEKRVGYSEPGICVSCSGHVAALL